MFWSSGKQRGFEIRDRDVISVTESVVARAQGNYAPIQAIAEDVRAKLGGGPSGHFPDSVQKPFSICLKGIARGAKKVVLMLSYPSDEVGNSLVSLDQVDEAGINPYSDVLDLERYRELFGENKHEFTGVDYVDYYCQIIRKAGAEAQVILQIIPGEILNHTKRVLTCDIHSVQGPSASLKEAGAEVVCGMDDILNAPVDGSGCNENTVFWVPTSPLRTASSFSQGIAWTWCWIFRKESLTGQESMWKSWYTATGRSRIR